MSNQEAIQDPIAAAVAARAGTGPPVPYAAVKAAVAPKKKVKHLSSDGGGGGGGGDEGGGGSGGSEEDMNQFTFLNGVSTLEEDTERWWGAPIPYSTPNSPAEIKWVIDEGKSDEEGLYYYREGKAKEDMGRLVETWVRACLFHEINQVLKHNGINAYVIPGSPTAVHDIDVNHFIISNNSGGGGGGDNDTGGGDDEWMQKNILMKDILGKLIGHGISVKAFGAGSWPLGDLARQFDNALEKFIFIIVEYESETKTENKFSNVTAINICASNPDGKNLFSLEGQALKQMQNDFFLKQRWGGFLLKRLRVKKPWTKTSEKMKLSKAVTEKYKTKKQQREFISSMPSNPEDKLLWKIKNYTSSDGLAKQYLIEKGGKKYFQDTIAANQIHKMVLYWIVYYGNLEVVKRIIQRGGNNKMIIFKSFFNHKGKHTDQDVVKVLRDQCGFSTPNPKLFLGSTLYRNFSAEKAKLWTETSASTEKLPQWLEEINFQPEDGNPETAKRPGSIWVNEDVFHMKTGIKVASKWNTTSAVRFPQFGMNKKNFNKIMGDNIRKYHDDTSSLFKIFKKSCRFQLNRTKFAQWVESMRERERDIRIGEEYLKSGVQEGGGRRDYKKFIVQTGGGKTEEIAADADYAEVARLEEEEAQQHLRDIEEEKLLLDAENEIRDIRSDEVSKIMRAEMLLVREAAHQRMKMAPMHGVGYEEGEEEIEAEKKEIGEAISKAKDAVGETGVKVEQVEKEIGKKIRGSSKNEKPQLIQEFEKRLIAAKKELDIKVRDTLRLRCEEMKEQPATERVRRARAASNSSANVAQRAFQQYAATCDKALDKYTRGGLEFILNLANKIDHHEAGDKSGVGHLPNKFHPDLQLWKIFKENNLIIKRIQINDNRIKIAKKKHGFGRALKTVQKFFGKKGGKHTRRKRKKCKKRTRRK